MSICFIWIFSTNYCNTFYQSILFYSFFRLFCFIVSMNNVSILSLLGRSLDDVGWQKAAAPMNNASLTPNMPMAHVPSNSPNQVMSVTSMNNVPSMNQNGTPLNLTPLRVPSCISQPNGVMNGPSFGQGPNESSQAQGNIQTTHYQANVNQADQANQAQLYFQENQSSAQTNNSATPQANSSANALVTATQPQAQPPQNGLETLLSRFRAPVLYDPNSAPEIIEREDSPPPVLPLSEHIKRFQTSVDLKPVSPPVPQAQQAPQAPPTPVPVLSKTSINLIINIDVPEASPTPLPSADNVQKKKISPKKSSKRKTEDGDLKLMKKKRPVPAVGTANVSLSLTTDKSIRPVKVTLPKPTVVDLLNPTSEEEKEDEKADKNEVEKKVEVPVIALNIPLVDPKDPQPGKSEVVVNVLRLSEEKYGWSAIHPKSKNAIDVMDDMIDDDDDDDDDDDIIVEEERPNRKGLSEEQLVKQHEARMNRKVGKYDYEDPFIDDIELQMEEEIISTKEGFFVYWGPLIDERNVSKKIKKK